MEILHRKFPKPNFPRKKFAEVIPNPSNHHKLEDQALAKRDFHNDSN
jgi:hypothetical protein